MTTINRQLAKTLRDAINAALIEVGNEYGMNIHAGNCTFDDISLKYQLRCEVADQSAIDAAAEKDFREWAKWTDIDQDAFGKSFNSNGKSFTICGVKPRNRKYPILAKSADGSTYKFQPRQIAQHFPRS